ncbi:MAG TPA: rRNA maturation RNase YbeY [Lachnospiraceae bacterium]|nr:rRNA maturation RNase YbeY [Lachnospiraceae bacterium]
MTLLYDNEHEYGFSFDAEKLAKAVICAVLEQEGCPYEAEVSLSLADEDEIRSVNREFRDTDQVTDVLSFPMQDFVKPAAYDFLEESMDAFHPESGELLLGDIMICVPRMRRQASEYGHGERREFAFLVAHSTLHLLGYDHMTDVERMFMEARQRQVLENLQITR